MAFDSDTLVEQMKLKGSLPDGRYEDSELLEFSYDAFIGEILPTLLGVREEFYVKVYDQDIEAGVSAYLMPSRASAGILTKVRMVLSGQVVELVRISPAEAFPVTTGTPWAFYIQNNSVILYPTPLAAGGQVRMLYPIRPSKFVSVAECGAVTAINGDTVDLSIPTGWSASNLFDLVRSGTPLDIIGFDLTASSVGSGQITFSGDGVPDDLAVGDYVTLAGESCFPLIPPEAHPLLQVYSIASVYDAMNHPSAPSFRARADKMLAGYGALVGQRIQGNPPALGTRLD